MIAGWQAGEPSSVGPALAVPVAHLNAVAPFSLGRRREAHAPGLVATPEARHRPLAAIGTSEHRGEVDLADVVGVVVGRLQRDGELELPIAAHLQPLRFHGQNSRYCLPGRGAGRGEKGQQEAGGKKQESRKQGSRRHEPGTDISLKHLQSSTLHASRITYYESRITFHASRFTLHVSRLTSRRGSRTDQRSSARPASPITNATANSARYPIAPASQPPIIGATAATAPFTVLFRPM